MAQTSLVGIKHGRQFVGFDGEILWLGRGMGVHVHWFSVPGFLEDFRSHVSWCAAGCSQDVKRFFIHYPREAEIRYKQICVVFWCSE